GNRVKHGPHRFRRCPIRLVFIAASHPAGSSQGGRFRHPYQFHGQTSFHSRIFLHSLPDPFDFYRPFNFSISYATRGHVPVYASETNGHGHASGMDRAVCLRLPGWRATPMYNKMMPTSSLKGNNAGRPATARRPPALITRAPKKMNKLPQ